MFDDADADNWSLPIVEDTIHGLISDQASWYYEVSKGYSVLWKLSDVGAFCHVTLKVTWQNVHST